MSDQHEQSIQEKVLAKNLALKQKQQGVQPLPVLEDLKEYAFGTSLIGNKWYMIEIRYNPETKQSLVSRMVETDGKTGASERLKIEVANWVSSFQAY